MGVKTECVVGNREAFLLGDIVLTLFNLSIVKLFNPAAVQTNQMVMVLAFIELIDRFAALKMAPTQNIGLLELRQHPVNRGQTHVGATLKQNAKNVLSRHMPLRAFLENFKYFQAGQCRFESGAF